MNYWYCCSWSELSECVKLTYCCCDCWGSLCPSYYFYWQQLSLLSPALLWTIDTILLAVARGEHFIIKVIQVRHSSQKCVAVLYTKPSWSLRLSYTKESIEVATIHPLPIHNIQNSQQKKNILNHFEQLLDQELLKLWSTISGVSGKKQIWLRAVSDRNCITFFITLGSRPIPFVGSTDDFDFYHLVL